MKSVAEDGVVDQVALAPGERVAGHPPANAVSDWLFLDARVTALVQHLLFRVMAPGSIQARIMGWQFNG
ncbi:hypothetical protein, partial [Rhizobium ecuadorense]|uniref:hypothetical protein n=1 Tax=Rhizobium ecuadorense TaxID=1671795 RepID=UPI001AEC45EE